MRHLPGQADCCWTAEAPQTNYPQLRGLHSVEVAVLGAGIVGVTAAIELASRGRKVALIEARRVGRQVTGRSTAKITIQHGLIYRNLIDRLGTAKAQLYADANNAGLGYIERLISTRRLDCDFEQKDAFVYLNPGSVRRKDLESEREAAHSLNIDAEVLDKAPLPFATGPMLKFARQAQFNPAKYLVGAARVAAQLGVAVFENSRVQTIEPASRWRVVCADGQVSAEDVVIATNSPLGQVVDLDAKIQPHCHLGMAFHIDSGKAPNGMFLAGEEPFHSIRTGMMSSGPILVVLGPRFNTGQEGDVASKFIELEKWVRENLPVKDVGWRWSNEDMDTADRLALVGKVNEGSGYYVATGFNAWGITNGTAAGLILADQICVQQNQWSELFDPSRPYPDEFNKGGSTASRLQSLELLEAGEGGVIERDGQKLAVWKDERGTLHTFAAECTHKGCLVSWNNADRTWDCPCHGSVFASDGSVIHGPAVMPLLRSETIS